MEFSISKMSDFSTDLEYILKDDSIFTLFDEDSVDKYALDTQLEEIESEGQQSFEAIDGKTYLNLPPLEEDSIDDIFEFPFVNRDDDTVQDFGSPLYDPSFGSIPMIFAEDIPRTPVSAQSESDSNSNDSSSNEILQFYGLQCQDTNSVDNFVTDILSEVRDCQSKEENISSKIEKSSKKIKELQQELIRINNEKPILPPILAKENSSNGKKLGPCIGKTKKGREMDVDKEYFDLPFGWTKEVVTIRNQPSMKGKIREDIYIISPGGKKKLKSDAQLMKFLEENPTIQCDLDVTSTRKVKHRELLNRSFA